jgi:hypothetical protein
MEPTIWTNTYAISDPTADALGGDAASTRWINSYAIPNPTQTEIDLILHQLLKQYYEAAEAYDRTVCTGPIIDGAILPATPLERALVSQHAATLWRELLTSAQNLGLDPATVRSSYSRFARPSASGAF